jgi:hypothetical protein
MMWKRIWEWPAIMALAIVGQASLVHGTTIPVTGWAVHNGSSGVTDGNTNSPTFDNADNITVMGTFGDVELLNDGDYVTVSTTLTVGERDSNLNANSLNTQLRIGLFDGPAGPVVADDVPNLGIIFEYTNDNPANAANRRLIREQTAPAQTGPFVSPVNIGNGAADAGNDSIQGANIGDVYFEMTLTRNSGMLDITGQISGTDSSNGNPYLSTYSLPGYAPAAVGFNFNRVGFFFGGNVDGDNGGTLHDVTITTNVPEPSSCLLAAGLAMVGAVLAGRRRGHAPR